MMYRPLKLGCRKISRSVDMVETVISDYMSPHCDLELEDSKQIFSHDMLAQDDTPSYQVWLQRVPQLPSRWTFTGILNLSCDFDLDHNRAIKSFHKTIQLMMISKLVGALSPVNHKGLHQGWTHKLHSISKLFISQVTFFSLFIFHRHSTWEPASGRVTYFILQA